MALPLTNLTLHLDASDTGNLFTTFSGDGNHTGTPVDGSSVEVWNDEGDGVSDVIMLYVDAKPEWRTTTPLMLLPCLDFDGSADNLRSHTQNGGSQKALSNFLSSSAFTVFISFLAESITSTAAAIYDNHQLIGDAGLFWGIHLKDEGGIKKAYGYNWDGNDDVVGGHAILENTSYLMMFRHESGSIYSAINGGTESSTVSGNTSDLTFPLMLGSSVSPRYSGRIGEIAIYNTALSGSNLTEATQYFIDKWVSPPAGGTTRKMLLLGVG